MKPSQKYSAHNYFLSIVIAQRLGNNLMAVSLSLTSHECEETKLLDLRPLIECLLPSSSACGASHSSAEPDVDICRDWKCSRVLANIRCQNQTQLPVWIPAPRLGCHQQRRA
jgi:hypothetical protein